MRRIDGRRRTREAGEGGEAMDYINDNRNLTVEGIRLREVLRREMEEIKKDTEAVKQEHRLSD